MTQLQIDRRRERQALASRRQWIASNFLKSLSQEEIKAINDLPREEKGKFLTQLQKALEGDVRFPFPFIAVDRFPGADGAFEAEMKD